LCLAASDALRALHDIGCDFDELDTARPGDAELVSRVAARARKRAGAPGRAGPARRRGLALWVGGGIVMAGTAAAAATLLHIVGPPRPEQGSYGVRLTEKSAQGERHGASVRVRASEPAGRETDDAARPVPRPEKEDEASSKRGPSRRVGSPSREASPRAAELDEPARLFSQANGARRRGELDRSLGIYQELQARFPGSPEAMLSHVMVGRLQLGRGANTLALAEFGRYLKAEPGGALAQEALEGKARALQRLGRVAEQRAAYQELLRRYPTSIYARTARERLGGSD